MEKNLRDVSWWQFRSKLERRLIILAAVVALIAFILLIIVIITASSKPNSCTKPACIHASSRFLSAMNSSVNPCTNFYEYVCGNFLKKAKLENKTFEAVELGVKVAKQFEALFTDEASPDDSTPMRNLKLLYKKCMDVEEIDARGYDDFREVLDAIGGWPVLREYSNFEEARFNWLTATVKLRRAGLPYEIFLKFDRPGYVPANKSYSLALIPVTEIEDEEIALKKERAKLMIGVAEAYGAEKARANYDMLAVGDFIVELNKIAKAQNLENTTFEVREKTVEEIQEVSPEIEWLKFLNQISYPGKIHNDDKFIFFFNVTTYMTDLNYLLQRTPKRVQANYMIWRVVEELEFLQPTKVRELFEDFHKLEMKAAQRKYKNSTRSLDCLRLVNDYMSGVPAIDYAEKHTSDKTKGKIHSLIDQIKAAMKEMVASTDVFDEDTRNVAIEKLDNLVEFIGAGYYDEPMINLTYSYLDLDGESNYAKIFNLVNKEKTDFFYQNYKNTLLNAALEILELGKVINAYYSINHLIVIPASFLQDIFYHEDLPDYLIYGSFGYVLGHEISHAITCNDCILGEEEEEEFWWSDFAKRKYKENTKCLIERYKKYTTDVHNITLNGTTTLHENVADMIGIELAYRAFEKYSSDYRTIPGLEDFSREQLFWVSAARFYCDPREEDFVKSGSYYFDAHAVSSFRVFAALSNTEGFSRDFNCGAEEPMNLQDKCKIF